MPECGGKVVSCDLPIHMDTYWGCSYDCAYCYLSRRSRRRSFEVKDGLTRVRNFIEGKRLRDTLWCDWPIPLHWGALSDGFQPCERQRGVSLKLLQLFADTHYPFLLSTKSTMLLEPEYLARVRDCNMVLQVSLLTPGVTAAYEPLVPSFGDRLKMIMRIQQHVRRVLIRIQPYMPSMLDDVIKWLRVYAASGVHGIMIESLVWTRPMGKLVQQSSVGLWGYPEATIARHYAILKNACHEEGLVFYCAEEPLRRYYSDSPTCCGCADIPGFDVNVANFNHLPIEYRAGMRREYTGRVFGGLTRSTRRHADIGRRSYKQVMDQLLQESRL